jgi:hypothetical protein
VNLAKSNARFDFIPNAFPKGFEFEEQRMTEIVCTFRKLPIGGGKFEFGSFINFGHWISRAHAIANHEVGKNDARKKVFGHSPYVVGVCHPASSRALAVESRS